MSKLTLTVLYVNDTIESIYSKQYDIDDIENRFLALLQWRRFNFFDKEVLKDSESDQVYDKLKVR